MAESGNSGEQSLYEVGQQAAREGRVSDAERAFRAVLDMEPEHAGALRDLGVLQVSRGKLEEGIQILAEAARLRPGRADLQLNLGLALQRAGRLQEAVNALEAVIKADPSQSQAWKGLGDCLAASGDRQRALGFYQEAVRLQPEGFSERLVLGQLLSGMSRLHDALPHLHAAARLCPERPELLGEVARALHASGDLEQAVALARQALKMGGAIEPAALVAARCYLDWAEPEDALAVLARLQQASATLPAGAVSLKAHALNMLGRKEEAIAALRQGLAHHPDVAVLWHDLVRMDPARISDQDLSRMAALAEKLPPGPRGRIQFARADVMEARQRWSDQLKLLKDANRLRPARPPYNAALEDKRHNLGLTLFSGDFMARARGAGDDSVTPLFIVGLPRSGTTLVEQILSSHSAVEPAGEAFGGFYGLQAVEAQAGEPGAEALASDPARWLPVFAAEYRRYIRESLGIAAACFTDKSMAMDSLLGLYAAAFPRARFIIVERHPLDLCFGIYKQLFARGNSFATDFEHCAHALSLFQDSIRHWQSEGLDLLRLEYEALVADQQDQTRRLLAHCDLPWEEQTLAFQDNSRAVATLSVNQVRQGLHQGATGRWQRYGSGLDPLREALKRHGVAFSE